MKPNTSNDFNDDGEEMLYNDGIKQGYAKAIEDVGKIIDGWLKIETCTSEGEHADMLLKELKQEIAKLAKLEKNDKK